MSYSAMIPLRTRESFFRDPFFSDCWDVMDRRRKEWERECNLRSKSLLSDFDDLDMGINHRGHLGRIFNRGHESLDKDDFLKSSAASNSSDGFGLQSDKNKFKVLLDVQQFSPEELTVKTCDNNIVIEGKHEEKKDPHGFVSRHFTRKYTVPSDVKVEDVQCNLSSDGVLSVTAPRVNPAITNKTGASSTSVSSTTEQRRSAERETQQQQQKSTTKEYPPQSRTAEQEFAEKKEGRRSTEREDSNTTWSERTKVGNKSAFGNLRDSERLHNHSRLFDSYLSGFPDFDLVPFWRRRDWSGGQGEIIERQNSNKSALGVLSDRDNFKVQLDVQQFTPEELSVKTIDNFLVIEGKHAEKKDQLGLDTSLVTRHFTRKYDIPADVKPEDVQCNFSSDGLLMITAQRRKPQSMSEKVTVIPIKVKHLSGKHVEETNKGFVEEPAKQHVIQVEKKDPSAPVNGVSIEEQISRSSSNQDAHKDMNGRHQEDNNVRHPGEHIIHITNQA